MYGADHREEEDGWKSGGTKGRKVNKTNPPFDWIKNPWTPTNIWLLSERVQSAFIPGSNETAVLTGIYWLQLRLAVMETRHPGV